MRTTDFLPIVSYDVFRLPALETDVYTKFVDVFNSWRICVYRLWDKWYLFNMSKIYYNLLELNVDKLFEERHISEIIELEKIIDAEIERKRIELRCMVG